ncbi:MAG: hypothetical protein WKF84_25655 [Pyrinomonadaceae bacterium]
MTEIAAEPVAAKTIAMVKAFLITRRALNLSSLFGVADRAPESRILDPRTISKDGMIPKNYLRVEELVTTVEAAAVN